MDFFASQHLLLLCLATVSLRTYSSNELGMFEHCNAFLLVYSIIFATCNQLMAGYVAFHLKGISESVLSYQSEMSRATVLLEALGGSFFIALISYDALCNRNSQIRTLNQIVKIERMLDWRRNFKTLHTSVFWQIPVNAILYFLVFQAFYYIVVGNFWILFYAVQCWMLLLSGQMVGNIIGFVETSAAYLNDGLRRAAYGDEPAESLVQLFEWYDEILILNGMIGNSFGLTIFGVTCNVGLVTIIQLHTIFITYSLGVSTWTSLMYNAINFIWLIPMLRTQIGMGFAASAAYKELEKVSTIVNHFENYGFKNGQPNRMVHTSLLSELRTGKCISVLGLVSLTRTTTFSILSSIITYSLVLVQFKQLEDDNKMAS